MLAYFLRMQKKFLSSLGLILLLNLLVKPFYILGVDAEVQIRVGKEVYGLYFSLLNLSFLFNMLIDLGINNFNNNNISKNLQLASKHFSKLFSIKAVLSLFYAVFTIFLGYVLDYHGFAFHLLLLLAFNQILISFILFARSNLAAMHLFKTDSVVSVLDRILLVSFCSLILFTNLTGGEFRIEWFVYLQTAAYALTLVFSVIFLGRRIGRLKWDLDRLFAIHIFKKSIPYATFMLIGGLYNRMDGIMLDQIGPQGSFTAGEYAQGFRFFEAASMFAYLFAVLLLPIYSRMIKEKLPVKPMVETATRLLLGCAVGAAIIILFYGDTILNWRYPDVTEDSIKAFSALMFGFIGVGMFYVYGTLMTADEDLKRLNYISIGGFLLNIVLNFYLIPRHGAFGAAIATLATQLFAGAAQLYCVVKRFEFGVNYKLIGQFVLFSVLLFGLNYTLEIFMAEEPLTAFFVASAGAGILLLLTGLFSVSRFLRILKTAD
jgi:O-antigen/teichoic acid export membrane protein